MNDDLQKLYRTRFSPEADDKKNDVWISACEYFEKLIPKKCDVIVDVAGGGGQFINNISPHSAIKKFVIDLNPDVMKNAAENVQPINDGTGNLKKYFQKESVSLFFMSNFLEHIGKDEIVDLLKAEHELLHENGELWVLTPNIRYTGGKYWDFFDHITPLTEKSIIEAAEMCGFKTKKCIKKFLPFTTKSRLPQSGWIVKLYLKLMPLSGFFFGEQSFIVFEK